MRQHRRMKRRKLNRGVDGVSHHRYTTDRVGTDKTRLVVPNLSDVMIPLAESTSSVRFHSFIRKIRKIRVRKEKLFYVVFVVFDKNPNPRFLNSLEKRNGHEIE